jgi:hypothetical protein
MFLDDDDGPASAPWIVALLHRSEELWRRMRAPSRPMRKSLLLWGLSMLPEEEDQDENMDDLYDVL